MAKIYNEVIIDMNPESSTFEEVLHEDSYEYSKGDMILAQRGVYQGADTMKAERDQSLWSLLQGQKRHRGKTEEQLGKRKLFGRVSDIVEKGVGFIPGIGQIAKPILDIFSKQAEQKLFELPEYKDKGGFWTSKQAAAYGEEDVAIREGADVSLLESILGNVESYAESEAGGDFMSSLFAQQGGRVPKYENGGEVTGVGKLFELIKNIPETFKEKRFGRAEEDMQKWRSGMRGISQHGESFEELETITRRIDELSEKYPDLQAGQEIKGDMRGFTSADPRYEDQMLKKYYSGLFEQKEDLEKGKSKAEREYKRSKEIYTGSKEEGLMALLQRLIPGGKTGMKEYAGGGMVESGSPPSIVDYFSAQGKTLGGSDTESLAKKLGRR